MGLQLPQVIGIVGKAGAGKDKFYWTVLAKYNYYKIAFADPLRTLALLMIFRSFPKILEDEREVLRVFPSVYWEIFSNQKTPFARTILQYLGTDFARNYSQDYWIDISRELIKEKIDKGIKVAVTDVRFVNEARFLKEEFGALLVRISGNGMYEKERLLSSHPSEEEMDKIECDYDDRTFIAKFLPGEFS